MKALYSKFSKAETVIAIVCLMVMMAIVFSAAVLRACGSPINWATDMALFLTAWATFLGADVAFREGKLVRVEMLTDTFPQKMRFYLAALMYGLILVFLIMMLYFGIKLSISTRLRTFQGIPGFSYTWVTISVPISSLFMSITAVRRIVENIRLGINADN